MAKTLSKQSEPQYLLIGEVLRPHGVRGELRMRLLTDYPERIAELQHVYLGTAPDAKRVEQYRVEHIRMHKTYGLLKLHEIPDRNAAEPLRGLFVMVSMEDAVPLEDDEIYLYQLIGMAVHTEGGQHLGELTDVLETGANDVYIVHGEAYGEILIPITDETLISTDLETRVITVNPPEGLLPE
jgi:16S rRNA processing protein RimM